MKIIDYSLDNRIKGLWYLIKNRQNTRLDPPRRPGIPTKTTLK